MAFVTKLVLRYQKLIADCQSGSWKASSASATLPVVTEGGACTASPTNNTGIKSDYSAILICQSGVWKGLSLSSFSSKQSDLIGRITVPANRNTGSPCNLGEFDCYQYRVNSSGNIDSTSDGTFWSPTMACTWKTYGATCLHGSNYRPLSGLGLLIGFVTIPFM